MNLITLNPTALYDPTDHGYCHIVRADGVSSLAFISGQGGFAADGSLPDRFSAQVAQTLQNLSHALEALGAEPGHICKLTIFVVDYDEDRLAALNILLIPFLNNIRRAQSLVPVPRLAIDGMLIEIEAIVAIED